MVSWTLSAILFIRFSFRKMTLPPNKVSAVRCPAELEVLAVAANGQSSQILLRAATSWPPVVLILRTQQMLWLIFSILKPLLLLFNSFWLTNIKFKMQWCWPLISIWFSFSEACPLSELLRGSGKGKDRREKTSRQYCLRTHWRYELQMQWHLDFGILIQLKKPDWKKSQGSQDKL